MTQFQLTASSEKELVGVHADLVKVVRRALELTSQEFAVADGIRTLEEQKRLVASGASKTLESRHLTGHAVDLVPVINGKLRWEWDPIYIIADAVRLAAREQGVSLRWGGNWNADFTATTDTTEHVVAEYAEWCRSQGKKAFLDGPHFELPKAKYP